MKNTKKILLISLTIIILSCGGGNTNEPSNEEGFTSIENEIKKKFGDKAFYTELTIVYNKTIGNIISTTVTENPASLTMGQWSFSQGNWKQTSDITLEVPEDYDAKDFMYQLNDKINLSTLGKLVEKSKAQLTQEKNIQNPTLAIASIYFPKDGNLSKTEYNIKLEPENGGTSFTFQYNIDGKLIKMDY